MSQKLEKKAAALCPDLELARLCDYAAREGARGNYGPLPDDVEPDVYELMTSTAMRPTTRAERCSHAPARPRRPPPAPPRS